jgi:hypothetical protein
VWLDDIIEGIENVADLKESIEKARFDALHIMRVRIEVIEECLCALGTMIDRAFLDKRFKEKWASFRKGQNDSRKTP